MSVILQLGDVTWSQGFDSWCVGTITNSGTENVKNIKIKVTDSSVFDKLRMWWAANWDSDHTVDVLNVWSYKIIYISNTHPNLAAGATKSVKFAPVVKAGAPAHVHNIPCEFQYEVY